MNNRNETSVADQILVEKVLRGDTDGFRTVMENTEGLVAQIVFKMIPNSEDRKDIAQDICLKVFQNLNSFKFQSKLSTWIAQIAYNTCINYLERKRIVLVNYYSDNESGDEAAEILDNKTDPFGNETEKFVLRRELSAILKIETNKLSPVYKTLISLYHSEELSYLEIVEITGLPEGTVKNYLFRARKILRDNLLLTYKKEGL
ncbi:MAG TPA: sigma-70 family RNA polymerase sigma factor [Sediminibacterium sp.]|nr:sigma-70 family RNA polymerase sigma factor [Sediminibacterium sp.]